MAEAAATAPPRIPLWRNVRFRRVLGQVIFAILFAMVVREVWLNIEFNAARRREVLGFGFLGSGLGFDIGGGTEVGASSPVWRAIFQAGLVNTLTVAGLGILLSSILGLILGVARLSPNWLVRKISQTYVEVVRNTPLAVQVVFWYVAVFLAFPRIENSLSVLNVAFFSVRGMAIPWFDLEPNAGTWGFFLMAGVVAAVAVWVVRTRINERTGRPHRRVLLAAATFLGAGIVGYLVAGTPTSADVPSVLPAAYEGGVWFRPELTALLVALVFYTSAFIGEIIRGSIQAVSKGQHEAAESLGLRRAQQLRLVILPQALRIAIPAINSQYLNLMKNSSLAVLIGFPELLTVASAIKDNKGHALPVLFLTALTYLAISLAISFLMNLLNRAVTVRGAR
jgi:general L-amino acid transport system permease protein